MGTPISTRGLFPAASVAGGGGGGIAFMERTVMQMTHCR